MIRRLKKRLRRIFGTKITALLSWTEAGAKLERHAKWPEAALLYAERLKTNSEDWPQVYEHGCRFARESRWLEAEAVLGPVCRAKDDAAAWEQRGDVLEKIYYSYITEPWAIDRLEEAFFCWRRSLELRPVNVPLLVRFGNMLILVGRIREGTEVMARFFQVKDAEIKNHQLDALDFVTISCIPNGIGHITLLDYYVKMRELGLAPAREVLVPLAETGRVNRAYLDYWQPFGLRVIDHPETAKALQPLATYLEEHINFGARFDGKAWIINHAVPEVERRWHAEGRPQLLTLRPEHRERGWSALRDIGLQDSDWFVTLHVRESGYTGEADVPPNNHRNSNIHSYLKAIQRITNAGGWVIRLGDPTMKRLPEMERVFDYAHSPLKSDWMDVFLCAENRFYLGTSSGPCMIPHNFGRKCALANYETLVGRPFYFGHIYSPKLHFDHRKQALRSFRASWEASTAYCFHSNFFFRDGIRFVDNTDEEIDMLVEEMLESVAGDLVYSAEDEFLQARFNQLALSVGAHTGTNSRIGRHFLRKYSALLD